MKNNKIFKYSAISILLLSLYGGNVYASGGASGGGSSPEARAGCSENHFSDGETSVTDKLYEYVCKAEAGEGIEITEEDITNDHITNDAGDNRIGKKITISNKNPFTKEDKTALSNNIEKTTANEGKITDLTGKVTTVTATADSALEKANSAIQKGSVVGKNGVKVEEKDGKVEVSSTINITGSNGITVTNNNDGTFSVTSDSLFKQEDKQKLEKLTTEALKKSDLNVSSDENIVSTVRDGHIGLGLSKHLRAEKITTGKNELSSDGLKVGSIKLTESGLSMDNKIIDNVADGEISKTSKQAVNGSQLNAVSNRVSVVENHVTNIDNKLNKMQSAIHKLDKKQNAGVASALAVNGIPQAFQSGKQLIGVGAGTRSGAHAIAVGFSRVSDNGKHIIKTSFAVDSEKKASGNIGYGYQW